MKLRTAFLFLIIFSTSCQTLDEDIKPTSPKERKVNYISADQRPEVINAIKNSINGVTPGRSEANRGTSLDFNDLDLTRIMEVIDTLNNTHYTFRVDDGDSDPFSFTNLIVPVKEQSIETPYLLNYKVNQSKKQEFINSGFSLEKFTGTASVQFLNTVIRNDGLSANLEGIKSSASCQPQLDFADGQAGNSGLTGDSDNSNSEPVDNGGRGGVYITSCYDQFVPDYSGDCWEESNSIYQHSGNGSSGDIFNPGYYWNPDCGPQQPLSYIKVRRCQTVYVNHTANSDSECLGLEQGDVGVLPDGFYDFLKTFHLNEEFYQMKSSLIPEALWKNGYLPPHIAGFMDGLWETIDGAFSIGEFLWAWAPHTVLNARALQIRQETYQMAIFMNELLTSSSFRNQFINTLKETFDQYLSTTLSWTPEGQYEQGKLIFEVVGIFVGTAAIKGLLKGNSLAANILRQFQNIPTLQASYLTYIKKFDLGQAIRETDSFGSFEAFKRAKGSAGRGNAWHHIVEQNPTNKAQFPAEALHNTANLIKLPHGNGTIHNKISGYYSSIEDFSEGKRVRDWLAEKSYEFQYEFGIQTLKDFGWVWTY